jgi:putative redox protein
MELLLASLGTCLTIGWVTHAARRSVDFRDLSIEVEGDYDLRGYLALDGDVRPGFGAIRYTVRVDSDASVDTLEEIRHAAERTSPMFDNVLNGTQVEARIETAT